MRTIITLALLFTLAACGGGGDSQVDEREHLPTPIPSVPAPDLPASAPAQ